MANQNTENTELDLTHLGKKVKQYYVRANDSLFDGILFIQRNIIVLAVIVIAGAALGVFLDQGSKSYTHKVFVIPNFESVDYLYEEVERINTKISEGDKDYLTSLGIKSPKNFGSVKIEPVVDIYNFLDDERVDKMNRRLELFEIIAEQGDVKKVLEENTTSRNYKTHFITISTKKEVAEEDIIAPLLRHFNANPYFKEIQKEYIANNSIKLEANEQMLKQIDSVVSDFNKGARNKSAGLMYYNDNTQLNELFRVKDQLLREQALNRINKLEYTDIIKQTSVMPNILKIGGTTGRMKFIVPFFFLLIFIGFVKFIKFYKKQTLKRKAA